MSEYQILTVMAAFAFAYSLIASRLEKTPVNGALVYAAMGMLCGPHVLGLIDLSVDGEAISQLAEIALAICLFTDASNANLSVLRRVEAIPVRLLLIGLGTVVLRLLLAGFSWQVVVYALLSLTVVRMLPVFVCLYGKKFRPDTLLFIGWFGPRGLASIVFLVMVVGEQLPGNETIVAAVVWTIALSIVLHGLSANPLAAKYGARVEARSGAI